MSTAMRVIEEKGDLTRGLVAASDGTPLYVETTGQGPAVMLVHGWTMSGRFWQKQTQALAAAGHQVVVPDLRGHGFSGKALTGMTLAGYARDLADIADALGLGRMVLAGWSLAGPVVLEAWRQMGPARLAGLGLVEMTPAPFSPAEWNTHARKGWDLAGLNQGLAALEKDRDAFTAAFVGGMYHGGKCPEEDQAWMYPEVLACPAAQAIAIYSDYMLCDYLETLPEVVIPVLGAFGDSEFLCFGPKVGEFLATRMPHYELMVSAKSGHMPFYEDAPAFNQAMLELCQRAHW